MKNCLACKRENRQDATYCVYCGFEFKAEPAPSSSAPARKPAPFWSDTPAASNSEAPAAVQPAPQPKPKLQTEVAPPVAAPAAQPVPLPAAAAPEIQIAATPPPAVQPTTPLPSKPTETVQPAKQPKTPPRMALYAAGAAALCVAVLYPLSATYFSHENNGNSAADELTAIPTPTPEPQKIKKETVAAPKPSISSLDVTDTRKVGDEWKITLEWQIEGASRAVLDTNDDSYNIDPFSGLKTVTVTSPGKITLSAYNKAGDKVSSSVTAGAAEDTVDESELVPEPTKRPAATPAPNYLTADLEVLVSVISEMAATEDLAYAYDHPDEAVENRNLKTTLDNASLEALGYLRNAMFARRGYRFERGKYAEFFNRQPWYEPSRGANDDVFILENVMTENEKKNVKLIQRLEKFKKQKPQQQGF